MSLDKYKNDKRTEFFFHKKIERINRMIEDAVNLKNRLVEVNYQVGNVLKVNPNGSLEKVVRKNDKHIDRLNSLIEKLTTRGMNAYYKAWADDDNFDEQVKMMIE